MKLKDLDKMLESVLEDTEKLGIETGKITGITIKSGDYSFCARCCKRERFYSNTTVQEEFCIEVCESVLNIPEKSLKTIIAHEVLHTCKGCFGHTKKWNIYAKRMNDFMGYKIQRTTGNLDMSGYTPTFSYMLECNTCGNTIGRRKRSSIIDHPERYKCPRCHCASLVLVS